MFWVSWLCFSYRDSAGASKGILSFGIFPVIILYAVLRLRTFSIRQYRAPQLCAGCLACVTHRAGRVVGHPMVLKSHLRSDQESRFGLRQSVGVVLRNQALRWLPRRVASSAEGRD